MTVPLPPDSSTRSRLPRTFWDLMYVTRLAPWDTGTVPPEVVRLAGSDLLGRRVRVLDVGCGTGASAVYLASRGHDVTGVDLSRVAVRRASRRARRAGVGDRCRAFVADVTDLAIAGPVQGPYGLVLDVGCFHGLPVARRDAYATVVSRVLAEGGLLLQYVHVGDGTATAVPRTSFGRRVALAMVRVVGRRDPPPRPTRGEIVALFTQTCDLVASKDGADRGRPSTWLLWRRRGADPVRQGRSAIDRAPSTDV